MATGGGCQPMMMKTNKVGRNAIQPVRHIRTYIVKDCDPHERHAKRRCTISVCRCSVFVWLGWRRRRDGGGQGGTAAGRDAGGWAVGGPEAAGTGEKAGGRRGAVLRQGKRRPPPRGWRTPAQFPRSPAASPSGLRSPPSWITEARCTTPWRG